MQSSSHKRVLPVIVLSQFAGTSLWFSGNAVLPELKNALQLDQYAVSLVTTGVMFGFVAGTLIFAIFSFADRFSPSKLFLTSSLLGAMANVGIVWLAADGITLFFFRFLTGFFLAGIYPVGMKIAADWYEKGLGKALGYLLAALVLGTALPHLLRHRDFELPWKYVLAFTSIFAAGGGLLMAFYVGDGPYRKIAGIFDWKGFTTIFRSYKWRKAAFGYFGHMWELYTFWGFVPIIIDLYSNKHNIPVNTPLFSFIVIGAGSLGCVTGGIFSIKWGSAKVAFLSLLISGICCFISPISFLFPLPLFLFFLFLWGWNVVPDSPQFSTLVAEYAPPHLKGTALTIYNSIGFTIAIISLALTDRLYHSTGFFSGGNTFLILAPGALLGLPHIVKLLRS